ncbi:YbaB/EbfC family nucleoid-associated protein [Mycobacterium camsae]|uniref:YbaB/EbfC family nucleoid-associated protein n=1 Tax=Mycobacterium gordonae TaxID=1778 RepID=UPI00197D7308|nr:YbaB/EbfC family nucleoid-associated protein [Mycobacterium gordonae]
MTTEMHPQVAEALRQMRRIQSALEDEERQANTASFAGTDEAKTVKVTLDWRHWLTDLYIQDGLLKHGAELVAQRINAALRDAEANAAATLREQDQRLSASLADIVSELQKGLNLTLKSAT